MGWQKEEEGWQRGGQASRSGHNVKLVTDFSKHERGDVLNVKQPNITSVKDY